MKNIILIVATVVLSGCSYVSKPQDSNSPLKVIENPTTAIQKIVVAMKPKPVVFQNGVHPTVRYDYYELHKHAFECKNDPYECKECPVGSPKRIISVPHGDYVDVPVGINVFFACDTINRLVPESGLGVDDDQFLCERTPKDGFVKLGGKVYSCSTEEKANPSQKFSLGTIQPGESKTFEIPITIK